MEQPLILNRYRPLGQSIPGGFSTVEIAWDTRIQRRVAIKRIPFADTPPDQTPGLEEARTAAMLRNSHIVSVHDFAIDKDEAFLIMEYIDGPTLTEVIELEDGMMGIDEVAAVVNSVAKAIGYAHENGVLHLDIKPDNILVDHTGHVTMTDFGVSQIADVAGFRNPMAGTVGHMPPEQISGDVVDQRTDEWAFAMVVYEMLCGENPYYTNDPRRSLALMESDEIAAPSELRPELDEGIDYVLLRALSADISERFETVAEFAHELSIYLGDPEKGELMLHAIVADEEPEDAQTEKIGLWDRFSIKKLERAGRALCALVCTWIVWQATSAAGFDLTVWAGCTAGVALASLLAPMLGGVLAGIICGGTLCYTSHLIPGITLLAACAGWWLSYGRRSIADASLPHLAPLTSLVWIPQVFPLACGFCLPVRRTLAATAYGSVLVLVLSACTKGTFPGSRLLFSYSAATTSFVAFVQDPSTWIILVTWVFAGILVSALCSKASRVLAIIGCVLGCLVQIAGQVLVQFMQSGLLGVPQPRYLISTGIALVLMCTVCALGAPRRAEEED